MQITSDIPEQEFMESLLNMRFSGVDEKKIMFILTFHAMANAWHFIKVFYYTKLLNIEI